MEEVHRFPHASGIRNVPCFLLALGCLHHPLAKSHLLTWSGWLPQLPSPHGFAIKKRSYYLSSRPPRIKYQQTATGNPLILRPAPANQHPASQLRQWYCVPSRIDLLLQHEISKISKGSIPSHDPGGSWPRTRESRVSECVPGFLSHIFAPEASLLPKRANISPTHGAGERGPSSPSKRAPSTCPAVSSCSGPTGAAWLPRRSGAGSASVVRLGEDHPPSFWMLALLAAWQTGKYPRRSGRPVNAMS